MQRTVRAFWPVVAWMAVVFIMSSDVGSSNHTSRIIGPLLQWLFPGITTPTIELVQLFVRKGGHVFEYALLALLTLRAVRVLRVIPSSTWSWRAAGVAFLVSIAYAATDEYHQYFVASRGASVADVALDGAGAALGLLLAFAWWKWRRPRPRGAVCRVAAETT